MRVEVIGSNCRCISIVRLKFVKLGSVSFLFIFLLIFSVMSRTKTGLDKCFFFLFFLFPRVIVWRRKNLEPYLMCRGVVIVLLISFC